MTQPELPFGDSHDDPSESATRLVWSLITLLRFRRIDFDSVLRTFDSVSERTFRRDIAKLRKIVQHYDLGCRIKSAGKDIYVLTEMKEGLRQMSAFERGAEQLVRDIARALGGPVDALVNAGRHDIDAPSFLRVAVPRLVEGSAAAEHYNELWEAARVCARVCFEYRGNDGRVAEREVEPYFVLWNAGRYYLVAYDTARRAFRRFALDAIRGKQRRRGTFRVRPVPAEYRSDDAIGLFTPTHPATVSVRFSARLVAGITARQWKQRQKVTVHADGSATLTFEKCDIDEVVRWSLQYASDAKVTGPPEAIARAQHIVADLASSYAEDAARAVS